MTQQLEGGLEKIHGLEGKDDKRVYTSLFKFGDHSQEHYATSAQTTPY